MGMGQKAKPYEIPTWVSVSFYSIFHNFPYDGETQSTDWIVTHTQIFPNASQASEQISVPLGSSNSDVPSS